MSDLTLEVDLYDEIKEKQCGDAKLEEIRAKVSM